MADGPETLILSYEPVNHPTPITFTTCYLNREFALENEGAFAFDINRQDITYRCRFELARNAAATERYWWYAEPPNVQGPDPDLAFGTVASRFPRMGRVWKALEEPPLNIAAMPQREVIWFYVVNNIEFWIYHPGPGRHAHDQAYRIRRFFGTNSAYREFHGLIRGRRDMLPIAGMRGKPKGAKFWAQAKYQYIHMAESLKARPGKDSTVPLGVHLELVVSDEMSDSIRGTYKDYYYEHLRMPSASGRFDESMGPSQGALKSTQRRFFRKDARDVPNKVFDFSPHKDPVKIYELWWDEPNETWLKHKSLKKGGHDRWYKFTVPQSMEIHVSAYLKKVFQESGAPGQSWKVERVEREHHSGGNANPVLFACTDENNSGARERRVIVKHSERLFDDPRNDLTGISTVPREVFLHDKLMKLDGRQSFVKLHTTSLHDSEQSQYYLYMQYAPHETLDRLMQKVHYLRIHPPRGSPRLGRTPEPFLWLLFRNLAAACHAMQHDPKLNHEESEAYVHYDIKPANILLFEPDTTSHPFPSPRLADYDHYLRLQWELITSRAGTTYWLAPEQLDQYPSSALGTDVFQIGLIMFGMLRGSVGGIDLQGGDALGDKSTTKPRPAKRARPTEGEDAEEGGEDAEEGGEDAKGGEDAEEGGENAEEGDGNAEEEEDYEEEYEEEEEDTVQLPDPEIKRVIDRIKSLERSGNLKARGDMVREYSIRLRRLIDRCLKANPRDRISITKLANRTSEEYNEATKSVDDEKMREWVEWVNTVTAPLEFREGRPDHFPLNLGFGRLKHRKRARVR